MKVDYSFIETFLKIIDGKMDSYDLESNVGFQTIISHALLTGNNFNIKNIDDAVKGKSDRAYGLRNLLENVERIKALYKMLRSHEKEWLKEVRMNIEKLFRGIDHDMTTVYLVIGYDIGIGINKKVCVNLNSEICLQDYRELISIIIHETAHTYYESIHRSILDDFKLETPSDMKRLLDNAIQYEGVGVFSAEEYRVKNNLPQTGSRIQEDYQILTDNSKGLKLLEEYKELAKDLKDGDLNDAQEFLRRCFGESKLPHRLGYSIFTEINKAKGIKGVKEAIRMTNRDFVEKFLVK